MTAERLATRMIAAAPDTLAPDGSEIRFLPQLGGGSMVHCRVPVGVRRGDATRKNSQNWAAGLIGSDHNRIVLH